MKVSKLEHVPGYLRLLYWGDYGSGKTTHMAYASNVGSTLLMDVEGGIEIEAFERCEPAMNLDRIHIAEPKDVPDQAEFQLFYKRLRRKYREGKGPFAFGIDSGSIFQEKLAQEIGREKEDAGKDPSHFTPEDWGKLNSRVRNLIDKFSRLQGHFIISALQRVEDENADVLKWVPAFTPSLQSTIGGYMKLVCYCRVVEFDDGGEPEFQGVFRPNQHWAAKDRFHIMPKMLVNPSFDRILDYKEGRLTVEDDPVMQAAKQRRKEGGTPKPVSKPRKKKSRRF